MICPGARKDTAQGQIVPGYCLSGRKGTRLFFFPSLVWHAMSQNECVLEVQTDIEIVPSEHPCADCKQKHQEEHGWAHGCPVPVVVP